jgi:peptide/nickel transport system substrate-binding protein/oligopeptide transport system substrate-binding protein
MMSTAALQRGLRNFRRAALRVPAVLLTALSTALIAGLLAVYGCGGTTVPDRRTLIDSRDNYDPRSLDPALSTDVPTGRAVS